jgi:hypothetical protein
VIEEAPPDLAGKELHRILNCAHLSHNLKKRVRDLQKNISGAQNEVPPPPPTHHTTTTTTTRCPRPWLPVREHPPGRQLSSLTRMTDVINTKQLEDVYKSVEKNTKALVDACAAKERASASLEIRQVRGSAGICSAAKRFTSESRSTVLDKLPKSNPPCRWSSRRRWPLISWTSSPRSTSTSRWRRGSCGVPPLALVSHACSRLALVPLALICTLRGDVAVWRR